VGEEYLKISDHSLERAVEMEVSLNQFMTKNVRMPVLFGYRPPLTLRETPTRHLQLSGDLRLTYLALLQRIEDTPRYFAKRLYSALKVRTYDVALKCSHNGPPLHWDIRDVI
jgi:hypothetical protein